MMQGVPVVSSGTEIDATNAYALRAMLITVAAHGYVTIAVDMSRTQFCDSAGLSVLIRAHKLAVSEGGGLRLIVPDDSPITRIVSATGIGQIIPIFARLDDALIETPAIAILPYAAATLATIRVWHADRAGSTESDRPSVVSLASSQ
jgi:anti-sigma B factor antagonist